MTVDPRLNAGENSVPPRRRQLYLSAFVIVGFAVPALLVWFFVGHDEPIRREALLALCAGIAASAVWWALFSRYAESEAKRLLSYELAEQRRVLDGRLSGLVREVERESRDAHHRNFPHAVYPSQDHFDLRFNRDLTKDLEDSPFYYFAGPSGVWVAARLDLRLKNAPKELNDVRVRMVDPTSRFAMEKAIEDRRRRRENTGKSAAEIEIEIRNHLVLSHVALWHARTSVCGSICLSYAGSAIRERLELFESRIYDSNIDRKDKARFPLTAAWGTAYPGWGAAKQSFEDDDFTIFAISEETAQETVERHLVENLKLDPGDWPQWVERYDQRYLSRMERGLAQARTHVDDIDLNHA